MEYKLVADLRESKLRSVYVWTRWEVILIMTESRKAENRIFEESVGKRGNGMKNRAYFEAQLHKKVCVVSN